MDRLTGADLLLAIRAAGSMSRAQLLRITGYVTTKAGGGEQLDSKAFNDALLAAARAGGFTDALPGKPAPAPLPDEPAPAPAPGGEAQPLEDFKDININIAKNMVKTVIALPLLDKLNDESQRRKPGEGVTPEVYNVIIDLHRDFPKGREMARRWVIHSIESIIKRNSAGEDLDELKRKFTRQYLFASLTGDSIRELVLLDGQAKDDLKLDESKSIREKVKAPSINGQDNEKITSPPRAIFQIWEDFQVYPMLHGSVATVKADAARSSFGAAGKDMVWAVIDSGIQADHVHFTEHNNLHGQVDEWHADFTGEGNPLSDGFGHGTHVAGIIAGEVLPESAGVSGEGNPKIVAYTRSLKADGEQQGREVTCDRLLLDSIRGVAPLTGLVSLKVIGAKGQGSVSNIIAALAHVNEINSNGRYLQIHGINLSVGYPFDPEWFACGQSQLCVEVNRLVRSGVVVVVAAGNTGYGSQATAFNGARQAGLALSINDPGNADGAITVGSTHRTMPHIYGVSYFSSKGPTGDGRLKPDLVAPGEKVLSCGAGKMADNIADKVGEGPRPNYVEDSGTSMAAPHVSGAAAAFLSIKNEFIGKPEIIKQIFLSTATDLGRERQFQGAGLLDLMRAIQSI